MEEQSGAEGLARYEAHVASARYMPWYTALAAVGTFVVLPFAALWGAYLGVILVHNGIREKLYGGRFDAELSRRLRIEALRKG